MARILVIFGTTDGHTAKVARTIRERLVRNGHETDLVDAAEATPNPGDYDAAVVAASVHAGKYPRQIVHWATKHAPQLNRKPTAFVSVCLGILEHNPKVDRDLESMLERFFRSTAWHPVQTKIVAGALKYSQYSVIKRWIMKRIVKKAGGDTDTSRDYEYTDWEELRRFADRFANRLVSTAPKTA
jgi:menaquinone-dependent protoporphyrinogen oxidase